MSHGAQICTRIVGDGSGNARRIVALNRFQLRRPLPSKVPVTFRSPSMQRSWFPP